MDMFKIVVVKGKIIKEKCMKNNKIKLIAEDLLTDIERYVNCNELSDEDYYEVYNDMGTFKLKCVQFANSLDEFEELI